MAYMNQAKKARIAAELAKVIPKTWKYSLAVRHHSSIVLTIAAAPLDLLAAMVPSEYQAEGRATFPTMNAERAAARFTDPEIGAIFARIVDALNLDNHDRSDAMTDYADVGHYVEGSIGRWDKPFLNTAAQPAKPAKPAKPAQPTQAAQPAQADKPASTTVPAQPESQADEIRTIDMTPTWGEWGNVYRRLAESGERAAVKHLAADFARAMAACAALQALQAEGMNPRQHKILARVIPAELAKQGF